LLRSRGYYFITDEKLSKAGTVSDVRNAIDALDLRMISEEELVEIIETAIRENEISIREHDSSALGLLMGVIMKRLRGKVDAEWLVRSSRRDFRMRLGNKIPCLFVVN
jgi:Glu-tRNA(Gln) amidotransferase subunit E-like FAD-binding protein